MAKSEVIGVLLVRDVSIHNIVVDLPSSYSACPSLLDALQVYLELRRVKVVLRRFVWLLGSSITT